LEACHACRRNAPFAELVRLSKTSVAEQMREEYTKNGDSGTKIGVLVQFNAKWRPKG
jgi:hypothetical protein